MVTTTQPVSGESAQLTSRAPASAPPTPPVLIAPGTRQTDAARLTLTVKIAIGVLAPITLTLAVLGGMGSFTTLRDLAIPWFGKMAWIVPVGIDIGILALLAWDLLNEYLQVPCPALRWTAWTFIAGTVYLNVAAAHGSVTGSIVHAAMPALFVAVAEGIRHLVRQWTGLALGTRIEPIPLSRWLLAPLSSARLWRHMVMWHVTGYRQALVLEHHRLQGVARLQTEYGRFLWRWRAPLAERLSLRFEWTGLVFGLDDDEGQGAETPDEPDSVLIAAAAEIFQEAKLQGEKIPQAVLAKRLRERGHRVANDRLNWLVTAAQTQQIPANDGTP